MGKITDISRLLITGRVGNVVFCNGKKRSFVRMAGKRKAPPSQQQLACRMKMQVAMKFLSQLRAVINRSWTCLPMNKNGYNAAVSSFIKQSIKGTFPNLSPDYPRIVLTKGKLQGAKSTTFRQCGEGVKIEWSTESEAPAWFDDQVTIIIHNETEECVLVFEGTAIRINGEKYIPMDEDFIGHTIHCYLFFLGRGKKLVSDSQYLGSLLFEDQP